MTDLLFLKTMTGFIPADQSTAEYAAKVKPNSVLKGKFSKLRNPLFHRKYFALLNVAFDLWNPGEIDSQYGRPEKNFDRFRKDITILAGYYEPVIRLDGTVRIEPKSISFASMDEDEFSSLYSTTIDVIIQRILPKTTPEELDAMVQRVLEFA